MNNDLISRKELKRSMELLFKHGGYDSGLVLNLIDNAPTVEPTFGMFREMLCSECEKNCAECKEKRPQGEWIPIKTRELTEEEKEEYPDCTFMYDCKLPEDGEEVLVTTWCGSVAIDTFCRDDGCYFEYGCDEGDVIAWMPKPEPYREEKQGDAE